VGVNRRAQGTEGEALAREYLELQGFRIVATNFRSRRGEIDIVARDGDYLVFCEVKCRESDAFGGPELAMTPGKARQIRKVAEGFVGRYAVRDQACRFDVVAIRFDGARGTVNHIRDAF
jgi:putative endonuclease